MRIPKGAPVVLAGVAVVVAGAVGAAVNLRLLDRGPSARGPVAIGNPTSADPGAGPDSTGSGAGPGASGPAGSSTTTVPGIGGSVPGTVTTPGAGSSVPSSSGPSSGPSTSAPTSTPADPGAPPEDRTYTVADAGSVTLSIRAGTLVVTAVRNAPGWTSSVEARPDRAEVTFRRADPSGEATLKARLEAGQLQVEIEGVDDDGPDD